MNRLMVTVAAFTLGRAALAQGFNLDCGSNDMFPVPSSGYGAGSGQAGIWNPVPAGSATVALVDLAGAPTGVSVSRPYCNPQWADHASTSGDDENLLDDRLEVDFGDWIFSGLAPGNYLVYTYVWHSGLPGLATSVAVSGSSDSWQTVSGPWPGGFALGVTHALHHATVDASGTLTLTTAFGCGFCLPVVAGIQLVPEIASFSFCEPGTAGVSACPCANPAGGPNRGCDNAAGTGGATLSASGSPALGADTVVFTTTRELPTALSIVSQGDATIASVVFGQGVRCVGGNLKRMYTKGASAGGIRAPGPGDPGVSARSAVLGDPIAAGTQRHYYVYYRDATVLGGCPAASTFNVTQAGTLSWAP